MIQGRNGFYLSALVPAIADIFSSRRCFTGYGFYVIGMNNDAKYGMKVVMIFRILEASEQFPFTKNIDGIKTNPYSFNYVPVRKPAKIFDFTFSFSVWKSSGVSGS